MNISQKKNIFYVAPAFLLVLNFASCDYSVPQHVRVKTAPSLHIPLGSPFGEDNDLLDAVNPAEIKSKLQSADDGMRVYDYRYNDIKVGAAGTDSINGNTETQTFLAHYTIARQKFDLSDYMDNEVVTPEIPLPEQRSNPAIDSLPGGEYIYVTDNTDSNNLATTNAILASLLGSGFIEQISTPDDATPSATVDLIAEGMADSVDRFVVKTGPAGASIIVTGISPTDATKFQLKVPQFGISAFSSGTYTPASGGNPSKLEFAAPTDGTYTLLWDTDETTGTAPATDSSLEQNKIQVYVRLSGALTSTPGPLQFLINMEWDNAYVRLGDDTGEQTGEFPMDIGNISEYLGGAKFDSIPMYLYIDTAGLVVGDIDTINIYGKKSGGDISIYTDTNVPQKPIIALPENTDTPFTAAIVAADSSSGYIGDLTTYFNDDDATDKAIAYDISLGADSRLQINGTDDNASKIISVDLLLVLPLKFSVTSGATANKEYTIGSQHYVQLDIEEVKDLIKGDLLGRSDGEAGILGDFNGKAGITVTRLKNNLVSGLGVAIGLDDGTTKPFSYMSLDAGANNAPITFTTAELSPAPVKPDILVLVKSADGGATASFSIKPLDHAVEPEFDFMLAVDASVSIDHQVL